MKKKDLKAQMEELFAAVEAMEAGGEFGGLEKLFEERFKPIKTQALQEALQRRSQAAAKADFPPSGLQDVLKDDAPDRSETARSPHAVGQDQV